MYQYERGGMGAEGGGRGRWWELVGDRRRKMLGAVYCQSLAPGARLEFHVGWSGWTRPPTTGGGGRPGREMATKK